MTYTWDGISFNQFVASQILVDGNNNFYYYDQNYNGFFPITLQNNIVQNVSAIPTTSFPLPQYTTVNDVPGSSAQATIVASAILTSRMNMFASQSNNIFNSYTQNPPAYVNNLLTTVLGTSAASGGVVSVLNTFAPILTSPVTNFAFQDILTNWPGGSKIITNLTSYLCNYQGTLTGTTALPQSLVDFKTKLLKMQVAYANSVGTMQQGVSGIVSQNTFGSLASAFPTQLGQLPGIFSNHLMALNTEIAGCLPSVNLPPGLQNIVQSIFGGLFNSQSGLPKILTPIDKVYNDILGLQSGGGNNFLSAFGNDSELLNNESNFVNQAVGLLSNIVAKIPIVSELAIPNTIVNPNEMLNILTNNVNSSLGNNTTNTYTPGIVQQAINALIGITASTSTPPISSTSIVSYTTSVPSISGILSTMDSSIVTPNISNSPDPSIALLQSMLNGQQTSANFAAIFKNLLQGQGYNNFDEVPLRPRNTSTTGSLGSYTTDLGYKF